MPNINRTVYAYWYEGKPLYHWCKENGVLYVSVMTSVYKGMSIKEAVEHHLANKHRQTRNNLKYVVDDIPVCRLLSQYQYTKFTGKIYRLKKARKKFNWIDIYNEIKEEG